MTSCRAKKTSITPRTLVVHMVDIGRCEFVSGKSLAPRLHRRLQILLTEQSASRRVYLRKGYVPLFYPRIKIAIIVAPSQIDVVTIVECNGSCLTIVVLLFGDPVNSARPHVIGGNPQARLVSVWLARLFIFKGYNRPAVPA